jgi:cytochrome d ubiquinol oxidase subunit I
MQTPAGFHIVGDGLTARAEITNFWGMVFNPSSVDRLCHSIIGAWLAGAFLVISVSAYYLLKKRHLEFARSSLKIGLSVASVAVLLQAVSGDSSARVAEKHQPVKFAAFEGIFKTQKGAPLSLIGWVDTKEEKVVGIQIPKMLSLLSKGDVEGEIKGLDQVPKQDRPNVAAVYQVFHLMIWMWGLMLLTVLVALYMWWKGTLFKSQAMLSWLVFSVLFPQIANQAGWVAAEMGRYPWIVQNLLRISEGLSKSVQAHQVLASIIMFGVVYLFLFILFIYLLNEKFKHGPSDEDLVTPYHLLEAVVKHPLT